MVDGSGAGGDGGGGVGGTGSGFVEPDVTPSLLERPAHACAFFSQQQPTLALPQQPCGLSVQKTQPVVSWHI